MSDPPDDPWLERWLERMRARAGDTPVLELGCGSGADTLTMANAGLSVWAIDRSEAAVQAARARVPAARIAVRDLLDDWPATAGGFAVVLASLSLHYFGWAQTEALFARVRAALRDGGLFVCRLNSTEDHHFGAHGHPEIEPGLHRVDGLPKRFFARADVDALMARGWRVLSLEHRLTHKYGAPKALWELVAERRDA